MRLGCGIATALLVACTSFGESTPMNGGAEATAVDGGADAAAGAQPAPVCGMKCERPSCVAYDPPALCASDVWARSIERDNPEPTCTAEAMTFDSPATLDASVSKAFEVDGVARLVVGARIAVRGEGAFLQVGGVTLETENGDADLLTVAACGGSGGCTRLADLRADDAAFHDVVIDFRSAPGGTTMTYSFDCKVTPGGQTTERFSSVVVTAGALNPTTAFSLRLASLLVRRDL